MKWNLIDEASTPSDEDTIAASLNTDITDERFTPTLDFLKTTYSKLNKELFFGYLPEANEVEFTLSDDIRGDELGAAECTINYARNRIWASDYKLSLDKSSKLTIHGWIGIVLHEMIHLLEYQEHPENKQNPDYDWHGEWFQNTSRKFKKYGFDFSEFYTGGLEMDIDDKRVEQIMKDEIFIQVGETNKGVPEVIKILNTQRNRYFDLFKDRGIEEIVVLRTDNPMSVKISPTTVKELESGTLSVYHLDKRFDEKYGPFAEVETIDLDNLVLEDSEEYDEEVETIRSQKGVIDVYRISPTAIRITVA